MVSARISWEDPRSQRTVCDLGQLYFNDCFENPVQTMFPQQRYIFARFYFCFQNTFSYILTNLLVIEKQRTNDFLQIRPRVSSVAPNGRTISRIFWLKFTNNLFPVL